MMYLNHTKAELKKYTKSKLVSIGNGILKKLPKTTLVNTVFNLEQLAKSKGIKSIGKIAKKVGRKAKKSGKRFKTAITKRTRRKNYVKPNGRTIQRYRKSKSKRKFSRKQLQAQALFARRSRAGTLRR
jgi:hypothetical protein